MQTIDLPPLSYADAVALERVAEILEASARQMRDMARAQRARAKATDDRRKYRDRLKEAGFAIAHLLAQGMPLPDAISAVAAKFSVDHDRVSAAWDIYRRHARAHQRETRNRDILRKARLGWTDKEIAADVGLTRETVNRIVRQALTPGRPPR